MLHQEGMPAPGTHELFDEKARAAENFGRSALFLAEVTARYNQAFNDNCVTDELRELVSQAGEDDFKAIQWLTDVSRRIIEANL